MMSAQPFIPPDPSSGMKPHSLGFRLLRSDAIEWANAQVDALTLSLAPFNADVLSSGSGSIPLRALDEGIKGLALASDSTVRSLCDTGIKTLRANDEFLFGTLDFPADQIEVGTTLAYQALFSTLASHSDYRLIRIWNYFPDINECEDGLERYQRFARARHEVFKAAGLNMATDLPAASAVGSQGGSFRLHFLAGRGRLRAIENPRQISAYRYPPAYGPCSPSFSRAMHYHGQTHEEDHLFISGTASIVGHATVAPRDSMRQAIETIENLESLLAASGYPTLADLGHEAAWCVYLRNEEDHEPIRRLLADRFNPLAPVVFLQGDICRRDLMIEIEGHIVL